MTHSHKRLGFFLFAELVRVSRGAERCGKVGAQESTWNEVQVSTIVIMFVLLC
jgi:hypothetical protein